MTPKTIENEGIVDTVAGWARRLGVSPQVINLRISKGWSEKKAVTTPLRQPLTSLEREERRKASFKKYLASEKGKATKLRKSRKYDASEQGKIKRSSYRKTEDRKAAQHRYNTSIKGRKTASSYAKTEKGKQSRERFVFSKHGKAYRMWNGSRLRAKKAGIPFTLTREKIQRALERGKCEVTGLWFDWTKPRGPFSPTLDRIIPSLGYTDENVRVVVWLYNTAKGDWTHDDVMKMVRALVAQEQEPAFVAEGSLS